MNPARAYVLIVEDDPDILKLLQTTLTYNGYRALTAHNGFEGLEAVKIERPQLIIADIMMPKLDGFGLVNRLRIDPATRDIPVIVVTATYVTPEDREFAERIGATRFLQKPIDLQPFLEIVRELLEQGPAVAREPLQDLDFYEGYRQRLEAKLEQRKAQIAEYKLLLGGSRSSEERIETQDALNRAISDGVEIKLLLEQIHEHVQGH